MHQLPSLAKLPVISEVGGRAVTHSFDIAYYFGKRHDNVIRDIENLITSLPPDRLLNFEETVETRRNPCGGSPISSPAYRLTRDGFTLLAMGFTGKKALAFKLAYIDAFNKMEAELSARATRVEAPIPAELEAAPGATTGRLDADVASQSLQQLKALVGMRIREPRDRNVFMAHINQVERFLVGRTARDKVIRSAVSALSETVSVDL